MIHSGAIVGAGCGNLFHHFFGPILARFSAPPQTTRDVWYGLLGADADRVLIGAWDPMLCPISGFQAPAVPHDRARE